MKSRPIEPTPVLTGVDALNFLRNFKNPKKIPPPEIDFQKLDLLVKNYLKTKQD